MRGRFQQFLGARMVTARVAREGGSDNAHLTACETADMRRDSNEALDTHINTRKERRAFACSF